MNYSYNADTDNFGVYSGNEYMSANAYPTQVHGMKWHKFLIYFSLWVSGILNMVVGALLGIGLVNVVQDYYYSLGEIAMVAFMAMGSIGIGVYAIVTRFKLKNFRRNASDHLLALQILSILFTVACYIINEFPFAEWISALVPSVVMASINRNYYAKRRDMFVY